MEKKQKESKKELNMERGKKKIASCEPLIMENGEKNKRKYSTT